uniref:Probable protein-export membrane protein SecG n=1 Tax=Toxarium undulatum TaxID=210620 RepID=A0A1D8DCR7_9STRA|nr:preprotein-translocase subunit g [Toxarium undulatum]YP_009308955.1 preprotein-translocase subunit g [Toxarium undulatum]AOS86624.1 preprotein-translocase subunit g [Toxarium undulatum]AOS86698.1 preprotein-translocase subunit g [Toxarium undulatum]
MLKEMYFGLSIFLIILIVLRPPKTLGLKSITSKTNLLGSPSSSEKILNNLTFILISLYCFLVLAIYF